ncbi:MAG: serine hydrolase domain-containing protein [Bacilli bacterium]|jgi:CubicO group peptidase (beta-lactamase class C family)|nr:serine hydrolase [Bacilli bacterium]MDD3348082.1 serine hydrolase [Bacilli bacterium]MDY0208724.1 serine hydrolase domain-containing protein [Bacilli bacterium]
MADYNNILNKIARLQQRYRIKGTSIVIADSSKIFFSEHRGFADFYGERKVEDTTQFKIGSITKVLTAIAIMQLVEEDLIDLDADIKEYIPEFSIKNRFDSHKITIKNILEHRSGLPSDNFGIMLTKEAKDYNDIITYLANQYLIAPPGKMIAYSNIGYTVLGIVIERVSKKKYTDYIQKNIFNPLGIDANFICTPEDFRQHKYEISRSYNNLGEEKEDYITTIIPAGSNTYMSAVDCLKIAQLFLNGGRIGNKRILKAETIAMMLQKPTYEDEEGYKIGLGLAFDQYQFSGMGDVIGHSGGTIFHFSQMIFMPEQGIAAVMLTNSTNGSAFIRDVFPLLLEVALQDKGYKRPSSRKTKKMYCTFRIEEYTGIYPTATKPIYISYKKHLRLKMGFIHAKMFLKTNNWFDLKPTGLSVLLGQALKQIEVKVEKETLSLKKSHHNGQADIQSVGVFVKPFDILPTWLMACGRYACLVEAKRSVARRIKLFIKDQFLMAKLSGGMAGSRIHVLGTVNETEAIILGYGRNTSETIFMGNKILTYMGSKFIRESCFQTFLRRCKLNRLGKLFKNMFKSKKNK